VLILAGAAGWLVTLAVFGTSTSLAFAAGYMAACAAIWITEEVQIR
jgi:hypothetical protein